MPLINLKTDLTSLRYGKDTLGGGYSGQPYIQTPIPDGFNNLGANEDFVLRGGINAAKDSLTDIKRLGKMFVDTKSPNGLLFIAKQQLLSRTAARTQTSGILNEGIYSPLNTLAQAGVVAFGGHLNKQGLNPFAQTGAYIFDNPNTYINKVKSTQPSDLNRLVTLYTDTTQNLTTSNFGFVKGTTINPNARVGKSSNPVIMQYTGGPGAPLGIGNTIIRFADQRTGDNNALKVSKPSYFYGQGQFSIDKENKQVGGLQVDAGDGNKPWIKGGIYFDGNAKNIYYAKDFDKDEFPNGLPSSNLNSPQSASLSKIPNDAKTWTPYVNNTNGDGYRYDIQNVSSSNTIKGEYEKEGKDLIPNLNSYNFNNEYQTQAQTGYLNPLYTTNKDYFFGTNNSGKLVTAGNYLTNVIGYGLSGKYNRLTTGSLESPYDNNGVLSQGLFWFNVYEPAIEGNTWPKNSDLIRANNTWTYNQEDLISAPANQGSLSPKIQDFRAVLRSKLGGLKDAQGRTSEQSGATANSLAYSGSSAGNIEKRVNLGDPGQRANKSYANYALGVQDLSTNESPYTPFNLPGLGSPNQKLDKAGLDRITSIPLYRSENVTTDLTVNDLVKFRIAIIDNNSPNFKTFIHFRAFLDSFSDSYNSTWNPFQYLGRGENFYTYSGFTRTISLAWTVAAQSKQELIPMYHKLNYLASTLAPDYSPNNNGAGGYMRGVLCQLTVGGYVYEQPGFITSLTYDIPQESPWEIAIGETFNTEEGAQTLQGDKTVKELPHIIKVSGFSFTPIQRFLPRSQQNTYNGFAQSYGPERFIALANGTDESHNNYDS